MAALWVISLLFLCIYSTNGQIVSNYAGGAQYEKYDGGFAALANLQAPSGIALDLNSNVYISDTLNNCIRRVDRITGVISTIAGSSNGQPGYSGDNQLGTMATLNGPTGVSVDSLFNIYVADSNNNVIRMVQSNNGVISTVAGNGKAGYSGDGHLATIASLDISGFPSLAGVAVDSHFNLFIADTNNNVIRKVVSSTGIILTVAGNGQSDYTGDGGPATSASLSTPNGVIVDSMSNLYIADSGNNVIRFVNGTTGNITTIAGNGIKQGHTGDLGPATLASLFTPTGIALDHLLNLYISDHFNYVIRKVDMGTGIITTVVGTGLPGFVGDKGPSVNARLNLQLGLVLDLNFDMYITDTGNNVIRKVDGTTGVISTVTGNYQAGITTSGTIATKAFLSFNLAQSLTADANFNLYFCDATNDVVRMVNATSGVITTIVGNGKPGYLGDGGPATLATINQPTSLALDSLSNIYFSDIINNVIRKVTSSTGIIATIAGNGQRGYSGDSGMATLAKLSNPLALTVDALFNVYMADAGNSVIRKVQASTGVITTVAGTYNSVGYSGDNGPAVNASLNGPCGLAVDSSFNIYIADSNIRMVVAHSGVIITLTGNGRPGYTGDNGLARLATLNHPTGLAIDFINNIYIADSQNNVVRKVNAQTGNMTTVAGSGQKGYSGNGGEAILATFNNVNAVAVDLHLNLYLIDSHNNVIRRVTNSPKYCPLGSVSTYAGLSCVPCSIGTYFNVNTCSPCPYGSSSFPGDLTCHCVPGFSTVDGYALVSSGCTPCQLGLTFASGILSTKCQACDSRAPSGYIVTSPCSTISNAVIAACSPGYYSPGGNSTTCLPCPIGTMSNVTTSGSCYPCPQGTFPSGIIGDGGGTFCSPCPTGTYNALPKQSICTVCPFGNYSDTPGATNCLPCTVPSPGFYMASMCSPSANTVISACLAGSYSIGGYSVECRACPGGTISASASSSYTCRQGTFSVGSTVKTIIGDTMCELCPPGTYNNQTGKSDVSACIKCDLPRTTLLAGSQLLNDCVCNAGYYKISDNNGCKPCVTGMVCDAPNTLPAGINYLDGYYSKLISSVPAVVECPNKYACVNSSCVAPFRGFLCAACDSGYFHSNSVSEPTYCVKCDILISIVTLIGAGLAGLLAVGLQIFATYKKNFPTGNTMSNKAADPSNLETAVDIGVYVKLMINQLQVISLVGELNFLWPLSIVRFFSFSNTAASGSGSSFSAFFAGIRCLLYDPNAPFPVNTLLVNLFTLIFNCCVVCLFLPAATLFRKFRKAPVKQLVALSIGIICFSSYTNIMKSWFSLFHCSNYNEDGGITRLFSALDTICYTGEHQFWLLAIGIPVGIFVVVGFPLVGCLNVYFHRRKLLLSVIGNKNDCNHEVGWMNNKTQQGNSLAFLYSGFKEEFWYWEIVSLARKISLSLISLFLDSSVNLYQPALAANAVLVISVVLQLYYQPYSHAQVNRLETAAQCVSLCTVYFGLWTFSHPTDFVAVLMTISFFAVNCTWGGMMIYGMSLSVWKKYADVAKQDAAQSEIVKGTEMSSSMTLDKGGPMMTVITPPTSIKTYEKNPLFAATRSENLT